MRRIILPGFMLILCALLLSAPAARATDDMPELAFPCRSAELLDGRSGEVLYAQNAAEICYPASVTKLMTMVLTLEAVANGTITLDDVVTVSRDAAAMGGSQVYLYEGEQRTVNDMLIAIAVGSGNDAAYAMAEYVGGTYDHFIQMMNEKAQALGMTDTHFVNPHGLHDAEHYTTAADLGKLAVYACSLPLLTDYTSIYEYEFRPEPQQLVLWNTNRLLKWYEGTIGLKTGYTAEAGRNLVAAAERDGLLLISVVLGCEERYGHFETSMELLNYGFNRFTYHELYPAGSSLGTVAVSKGTAEQVDAVVADAVGFTAPKNAPGEITEQVELAAGIAAPVSAGDPCGVLTVYRDGAPFLSVELVAGGDVAKAKFWRTWGKLLAQAF